jgi:hypothetical protein
MMLNVVVFGLSDKVRTHLNYTMPGGEIGRGGPITTPLRPPDLTPLDIFFCGCMKNLLFPVKNKDLQQMKACMRNAVAAVTHSLLQNTWTEVEYRLDCRRASSGAHIEI